MQVKAPRVTQHTVAQLLGLATETVRGQVKVTIPGRKKFLRWVKKATPAADDAGPSEQVSNRHTYVRMPSLAGGRAASNTLVSGRACCHTRRSGDSWMTHQRTPQAMEVMRVAPLQVSLPSVRRLLCAR